MKKEYCVMKDGINIESFDTKKEAIDYAKKNKSDEVLLIKCDIKAKDYKNLDELGCEILWYKGENKK